MINREVWSAVGREAEENRAFCLVLVVETTGSVPRRAGSAMLVRPDGSSVGTVGGGTIERGAVQEALAALEEGTVRRSVHELEGDEVEEDASVCGGTVTLLHLPEAAPLKLHLFGAGHVARAVAPLAANVGYEVVVYDETEQFITAEHFPDAARRVPGPLPERSAGLAPGPKDAVVILTGSHALDFEILRGFRGKLPSYLGIIASERKAALFREQLAEDGWPAGEIERIHMPIGLAIGSRTPAEIAVSILAELIQERGPVE